MPSVPHKRKDSWSEVETDLMRQIYPKDGAKGCHRVMPNRTVAAISKWANKMKVHREWPNGQKPQPLARDYSVEPEPISDLDRIALYPWGYITSAGELKPMIGLKVAA